MKVAHVCLCSSDYLFHIINYLWFPTSDLFLFPSADPFCGVWLHSFRSSFTRFHIWFYFFLGLLLWSCFFVFEGMCRIPWTWWVATGPRDHLVAVKAWRVMERVIVGFAVTKHTFDIAGSPWFSISFVTFPVSCYVPKGILSAPHAVVSWTLCSFISSVISCEYNSMK